jgi:amino acid permease
MPAGSDADGDNAFGRAPRAMAAFNIFASAVGGSLVALPGIFQKTGLLAATGMMAAAGVTAVLSVLALVELSVRTGSKSYGDITKLLFGPVTAIIVEVLIVVMATGVICSMFIVLHDVVQSLFAGAGAADTPWVVLTTVLLVELVPLPLSLPTSIDKLIYGSFFCIVAFLFLVAVLWVDGIRALPEWHANETAAQLWPGRPSLDDVGTAAPVVVLALGCQLQIMSVVQEQIPPRHRSTSGFLPVAAAAVGAMLVVFFSCGAFGVLSQPPNATTGARFNISDDVTKDLRGVSATVARVGLGCAVMLVAPLVLFPTRQAVLSLAEKCGLKMTIAVAAAAAAAAAKTSTGDADEAGDDGGHGDRDSELLQQQKQRQQTAEAAVAPLTFKGMTWPGRVVYVGVTVVLLQLALVVALVGSNILVVFRVLGGGLACPLFLMYPAVALWRVRTMVGGGGGAGGGNDAGSRRSGSATPLSPLLDHGATGAAAGGAGGVSGTMPPCLAWATVAWLLVFGGLVSSLSIWSLALS